MSHYLKKYWWLVALGFLAYIFRDKLGGIKIGEPGAVKQALQSGNLGAAMDAAKEAHGSAESVPAIFRKELTNYEKRIVSDVLTSTDKYASAVPDKLEQFIKPVKDYPAIDASVLV